MDHRERPDACHDDDCCGGMSRRTFLAASAATGALPFVAGPFSSRAFGADTHPTHRVPVDKKLSPAWVKSLYERGEPKEWTGDELNALGMPIGGIAAGQLYLTGDGTLAVWGLYNQRRYNRYGSRNMDNLQFSTVHLDQGFALEIESGGRKHVRALRRSDFPDVRFIGEYPLGIVKYPDPALPLEIELQAFSPFIPQNAPDSALPATVMELHLKNTSQSPVTARVAGWLENPVGYLSAKESVIGGRGQRIVRQGGATRLECHPLPSPPATSSTTLAAPEVFADFEGSYGEWKAEGEAFGSAPSTGSDARGYQGEGFAGSGRPNDAARGNLLSPEFALERPYINFLIGGGPHAGTTCVRLLIDGEEVRQSTGDGNEALSWKFWKVAEYRGRRARIEIVDAHRGGTRPLSRWAHVNVDRIEFADAPKSDVIAFARRSDWGTASLMLMEDADAAATGLACPVDPASLFTEAGLFSQRDAAPAEADLQDAHCGALGKRVELAPGQSRVLRFALSWHFPIRPWDTDGYHALKLNDHEDTLGKSIGNFYNNRFKSSREVGDYLAANYERLAGETRRYHRVFYEQSTLPRWLLLRIGQTPSILASGTVHWRENGRFWGWEGVGCCAGTCTHVWNYAQAAARLFPELERSMREMQDLAPGVGRTEEGLVHYRGDSTWQVEGIDYAADGQAGTVLKSYREHQMSADDAFLKRNWPNIKRVLEYQMSRDDNADGLLEDEQHTTYDENIYGANTFVGSLYLAALRAGEEMARQMGDDAFADRCRRWFESGSRVSVERLWNGEYFIQEVDPDQHPRNQYGNGCFTDQLFGQAWAHQLGLGYLYSADKVQAALQSVYKYNWAPDVAPQTDVHRPGRWFALAGDAGMFVCTFPKGDEAPAEARRYFFECWTGVEYQAAGHMIHEGMLEEGLSVIRGIHDRHNGVRWNPYNEFECGDHYARAMAAWGCLLALCGFEYDGPAKKLGFAPKINSEDFRAFFSAAEGWGSISQKEEGGARRCAVHVEYGTLALEELTLDGTGVQDASSVQVKLGDQVIPATVTLRGKRVTLGFEPRQVIAGESLSVEFPVV